MNPPVYSSLSRKYGLGQSLLDRLYDDDVYRQKAGLSCKVELNENHRSHPQVMLYEKDCTTYRMQPCSLRCVEEAFGVFCIVLFTDAS